MRISKDMMSYNRTGTNMRQGTLQSMSNEQPTRKLKKLAHNYGHIR